MNDTRPGTGSGPGIREIVFVADDLRESGGERAELARTIGRVLRGFAERRDLGFRGLHLAASDFGPALDGYRSFDGRRGALARALAALQLRGAGSRLLVFGAPELARVQTRLPAPLRSRSVVWAADAGLGRPRGRLSRALSAASRVLTLSRATRERLSDALPAADRVTTVHPGIDREPLEGPLRASLVERAGRDFVLSVQSAGSEAGAEGQMELLESWPGLIEFLPDVWLAVVSGEGERGALERRSAELGLGRLVRFLGPADPPTLNELYQRAVAFALPSAEEGFGLGLLEAMRAARPCIAAAGPVSAEIVVDGYTGTLLPAWRRETIARGLAGLLGDRERARRMGVAGRARFLHDFTLEVFDRRLAPLLDRVVAGEPEPFPVAAPSPRSYDAAERLRLEVATREPTPEPGTLRRPPAAAADPDAVRQSGDFETPSVPVDVASLFDVEPGTGDEDEEA